MWTIALESVFMFVSSMVVFVHIALGGVVGLDIRRSIVLKDLLFGALLSILITIYTITKFFFLSSVERKNWNDSHLIHAIINLILLENLLMNRSAMAYWRQGSSRLINERLIPRSFKVADNTVLEICHKDGFTQQPIRRGAIPQNKSTTLPKVIVVQPK